MSKRPAVPQPTGIPPGRYRHYKGGTYQLLHLGYHSDHAGKVAIYVGSDGIWWVRPYEQFIGFVLNEEGKRFPRFVREK